MADTDERAGVGGQQGAEADALLTQGLVLARGGQFGEAIATFSQVFRRFEASGEQALRERAVAALLCTACLLFAMSQTDDALAVVGKAKRKFAGDTGETLTNALHALQGQPILQEDLGREFLRVSGAVRDGLGGPPPK